MPYFDFNTGSVKEDDSEEMKKIQDILNQNKDKSFIQRILTPELYPKLDLGNGQYATHKMAWGESDGKYMVFPTIIHQNGKLVDYGMNKAFEFAKQTGQYISFDSSEKADWFSQSYKKIWNKNK